MTRITNNILVNNMKRHLQNNMSDLDEINQKLSSGKQFQHPSEAPIKTARSMEYDSLINTNKQYKDNLNQAQNWLKSTETALKDGGKVLQRVRELAIHGANGSLTQTDQKNIATEVKQLKDELINIGNTKLADRYIFSGQKTATAAFDQNGNYQGDQNQIQREINKGVNLAININGKDAFKGAIDTIDDLINDLNSGNTGDVSDRIGDLDQGLNNITSLRANVGAKINRMDMSKNRLEEEIISLKQLQSTNEDVDIAKVITDLKMEESVYRASLAAGARSIQPSLVDFLR